MPLNNVSIALPFINEFDYFPPSIFLGLAIDLNVSNNSARWLHNYIYRKSALTASVWKTSGVALEFAIVGYIYRHCWLLRLCSRVKHGNAAAISNLFLFASGASIVVLYSVIFITRGAWQFDRLFTYRQGAGFEWICWKICSTRTWIFKTGKFCLQKAWETIETPCS